MKKILVSLVAIMFMFAPLAFGLTITDVGLVDTFLAQKNLANSNPVTETTFVNDTVGGNNSFVFKFEIPNQELVLSDLGGNRYAFDFGKYLPEYFIVKKGRGSYLYKNLDELQYGVVQNLAGGPSFSEVSHISIFGGVQVPEPATLILFGAGIAGLAMYRRKRS